MRIIVHGQQAFGQKVLEAILQRGDDEVVAVYSAPTKEGGRPDPLVTAARERGLALYQPASYRKPEIWEQMASLEADLCVMAYVTLFVPEQALNIPRLGSINFHPSLLPRHRGGSSINWAIIWGETRTGVSVFWPDDGLDEGPLLLQKEVEIADDDTLGSLYFGKLFPLGVEAMLEAVDLVRAGRAPREAQDHARATYEGWCRGDLVRVNWHMPTQVVWNLVRGCNPQPGAWTLFEDTRVALYDCRRIAEPLSIQPGQVSKVSEAGIQVATADGQLLLERVRAGKGEKRAAAEWAAEAGIKPGARFR